MLDGLRVGDRARFSRVMRAEEVVPRLFPDARVMDDMPEVLASAYMIGLFEWACVEQIAPYYEEGEGSLGTGFELTHVAPTLSGMTVTVTTEIESIDGKFIWFHVSGHDGVDMIGAGRHQRAVVQWERFRSRLSLKAGGSGSETSQ